ncbi:phosphoglycerate kinase [Estrella lausannensis]|uniref:Phosphoglycerate kinase n=1 Tax=Estrella lausannensis TaxID=483423 RepID=A0A0H5DT68_9BACT|nr:phosphoglycerate kinase [Estrella lausannensis]CRX39014.1 Phosphoglycerate kinase [Estrella lausannensis]
MNLKTLSLENLPVKNQKVLMRVDFNVPIDKSATIKDDTRIRASLPSITHILDRGGSVILMSHLGRPKGVVNKELSLRPCAARLQELLGRPVLFAGDCVGPEATHIAKNLNPGEVLLLENLRFHAAEEKPEIDPGFAKSLAELGTLYVNDAFGTAHRAHTSTVSLPKLFPGKAAAGFLIIKEIRFLGETLQNPKRPFLSLIGGAKISSKIGVLKALLNKVDSLLIGGGMAYTFMKARGESVGKSLFEEGLEKEALLVLKLAEERKIPVLLPVDHVVTDSLVDQREVKIVVGSIPQGYYGVDIGPETVNLFKESIAKAGTIFWNGPMGIFEDPRFGQGTKDVAKAIASSSAISIIGGGDSVAAAHEMGVADKVTHLSTGGGASMEYIELGTLPGIEALTSA